MSAKRAARPGPGADGNDQRERYQGSTPRLVATPPTRAGSYRWRVALAEDAARVAAVDPADGPAVARAARQLGASPDDVLGAIAAAQEPERAPDMVVWIRQLRGSAKPIPFRGTTALEAFNAAIEHDVSGIDDALITWDGVERIVALDFDPLGDSPRPLRNSAEFTLDAITLDQARWAPQPAYSWVTHGSGFRLTYIEEGGATALGLGGAWSLAVRLPPDLEGWRVTTQSSTRHPASVRDGRRCGRVRRGLRWSSVRLPRHRGRHGASPAEVSRWLEAKGWPEDAGPGSRAPAGVACPAGRHDGQSRAVVLLEDDLVHCHACGRSRAIADLIAQERGEPPASDGVASLDEAARELVHLPHMRLVLPALVPWAPARMLEAGWRYALRSYHSEADELVRALAERAGTEADQLVRSSYGAWLGAESLEAIVPSAATMRALPWARCNPSRADNAASSAPLAGFRPLEVEPAGILLPPGYAEALARARPDVVPVRRPPRPGSPPAPDVGDEPPSPERVEAAWATFARRLPGFSESHRGAVTGLLTAQQLARLGGGLPPVGILTGVTGAAKSAIVRLAAAAVGHEGPLPEVALDGDAGRGMGLALEAGVPFLLFEEVGRCESSAWSSVRPVLAANSSITFAAKYRNEVTVPIRAPIVLIGSTLPPALLGPEMSRRGVAWTLPPVGDWRAGVPDGDIARARHDRELREALDAIVGEVWHGLAALGNPSRMDWRRWALRTLPGACRLDELADGGEAERDRDDLRALYSIYRESEEAALRDEGGDRRRRWIPCAIGAPGLEALARLLGIGVAQLAGDALLEPDELPALRGRASDLERRPLGEVLGLPQLPAVLVLDRRGRARPRAWRIALLGHRRGAEPDRRELPEVVP